MSTQQDFGPSVTLAAASRRMKDVRQCGADAAGLEVNLTAARCGGEACPGWKSGASQSGRFTGRSA
jgi:hypothetical protein